MATMNEQRDAAMAKVAARPSRPSLAKMRQTKAAATSGRATKASAPKMVGKRKSSGSASASLAKGGARRPIARTGVPSRKSTRHRSASGSAPKGLIAGRHRPSNDRYKTGWWRPVRQSWMSQEVWDAYRAINRFRNKAMSKGLRKASLGKQIYGKEGPGHAGYGTGKLQRWVDKVLRKGDGTDPHMVDLTKWFAGAASALDYHHGDRSFEQLMREQRKDPDHFMRYVIERMQDYIPELKKLSKRGINDIIKNRFYTAQYGPDGRAK